MSPSTFYVKLIDILHTYRKAILIGYLTTDKFAFVNQIRHCRPVFQALHSKLLKYNDELYPDKFSVNM